MLMPHKVKHRKQQRGDEGIPERGARFAIRFDGLQTLEPHWITARQIEAAVSHNQVIKRGGRSGKGLSGQTQHQEAC
jgi:large subunit ribosomal protein L16